MPNLAVELQHLNLANRHIADAEAQLRRMKETIDLQSRSGSGGPPQAYLAAFRAAEKSLDAFHAHRALIVQTIRDIEEGRLVDTGKGGNREDS